ncbi:MAG: hypothetical protein ACPGU1_22875 [Myxococcota bacterium]
MNRAARIALICVVLPLLLMHCADDPVAYSDVVSLKLSGIKDGDAKNGVTTEEKNINTESGNPYGTFLANAREALDGGEPGHVELNSALVGIHADSKGVAQLDQVFSRVELFISSSTATYPLGDATSLSASTAAFVLSEDVDWETLQPTLVQGDFKVGVRVDILTDLEDDWDAKLFLDLNFSAYE